MSRPEPPSTEILNAMAEHVAYDVWMLEETSQLLNAAQSLRLGRPWQSAILESLLIHTRNLIGFLYPPRNEDLRSGDVVAADYPSTEGLPSRPDVTILGTTASDLSNSISRRVAHVHEVRTDPGMDWAYQAVARVLVARALRYIAAIDEPHASVFRTEFNRLG